MSSLPAKIDIDNLGLQLPSDLTYEEWVRLGRRLGRFQNATSWAIGDWAFHGEWTYGRSYEDAIEVTGLAYQTIADLKYVAGRFDRSRRRENLSFSHHREVAPLPLADQDGWLDRAAASGWSREQLRVAIAAAKQEKRAPLAVDEGPVDDAPASEIVESEEAVPIVPTTTLELTVPIAVADIWNRAADLAGLPLDAWMIRACSEAAEA